MYTQIIKADSDRNTAFAAEKAAEILKNGGLVAIPTETVYGLACNALDENAAREIFTVKGRPSDNPLIVHISDFRDIYNICDDVPVDAEILAERFLPGPLTMILKKKSIIPDFISAGLPTVAVRLPAHPAAREIIRRAGFPLAAPSANLSGRPSTTTAEHVVCDLYGKIPLIIDGGCCEVGLESTILDLTADPPAVLRPGAISPEVISSAINKVVAVSGGIKPEDKSAPKAPGMKYRHYAPSCPCTAVFGSAALCADYILKTAVPNDGIICFDRYAGMFDNINKVLPCGERQNPEIFASRLFNALRMLDNDGAEHIYIQCPQEKGIGLAVKNRVEKSSGGDIISLFKSEIIGVTGKSGSGKTLICSLLRKHGAVHIDCDAVYNELIKNSEPLKNAIKNEFGQVFDSNGDLDRGALAKIAFSSESNLDRLNKTTHPFVTDRVLDIIDKAEREQRKIIVIDAPVLFECALAKLCDVTAAVICRDETSAQRICERDKISMQAALQRIKAQRKDDFFRKVADIIIENDVGEDINSVERQLVSKLEQYGIKIKD